MYSSSIVSCKPYIESNMCDFVLRRIMQNMSSFGKRDIVQLHIMGREEY